MSREIQILDIRVNRACTESGLGTDKTKLESNAVGKVSESCHSLKSSKFLYMWFITLNKEYINSPYHISWKELSIIICIYFCHFFFIRSLLTFWETDVQKRCGAPFSSENTVVLPASFLSHSSHPGLRSQRNYFISGYGVLTNCWGSQMRIDA